MRRLRTSVALTVAATFLVILGPIRSSSQSTPSSTTDDDDDEGDNYSAIDSVLVNIGESEAFAGKKGTWACSVSCITHFSPGNPRYQAPGCPTELTRNIKKEYSSCQAKTKDDAETLFYDYCNSECQNKNDQCLCKHHRCRFVN